MRTFRFFTPQALGALSSIELTDEVAHHAINVLRIKAGASLTLFSGEGGEYQATVTAIQKKSITIKIGAFNPADKESPLHIHLAIGISKGDRFDFVLQKATELGVSKISPLFTARTEVKLTAGRQEKAQQRWQKIIINACEQSGRNRLPQLNAPTSLDQLLLQENSTAKYILHPQGGKRLNTTSKPASVCLLIGPEGGFSDTELACATQARFLPLTLGERVLRTETAPIAALGILQFVWGDLNSGC